MARKLNGIELTRYDDLFKTGEERSADRQERVQIVSAEQVFPYARQPYSVDRPSADLVRLMDSIERTGIAEPLIVRPRSEGGYEIISGHRRDYCAKVVGLDTRPVIVRNYSDEDADILVVDYNINRENLLPSEKAKAYKGAFLQHRKVAFPQVGGPFCSLLLMWYVANEHQVSVGCTQAIDDFARI